MGQIDDLTSSIVVEWPFNFPGMNNASGHKRSHWTSAKKLNDLAVQVIIDMDLNMIHGKVSVKWERWSTVSMDWDNFASSFKCPMDACVKIGIIKDDSPEFIPERPEMLQYKIERTENPRTRITFTPLEEQKAAIAGWE